MQDSIDCYASHLDSYTDGILRLPRFMLKSQQELSHLHIAYRLHGNPAGPLTIALGGISAHRGLNAHANDLRAWWPQMVGPGLALDTKTTCILSFDYLGGSAGSSGPHEKPWPEDIAITTEDQARIAFDICQSLGHSKIDHWVGASYGGMVGLCFAQVFPQNIRRLSLISAAHRAHPMAMAWRYIQREIVRLGRSTGETKRSLALARALAMTSYRSPEEFEQRFQDFNELVSYLEYSGQRYAQTTHEQAFHSLSASIDTHQIDARNLDVDMDIIGVWEDRLVPAPILKELADLTGAKLHLFHSVYGHDAFLKEIDLLTKLLQSRGECK